MIFMLIGWIIIGWSDFMGLLLLVEPAEIGAFKMWGACQGGEV